MRTPLKSEDESVQSDLELFLTALPSSSGRVTVEFDDTMCRKSAEAKSAALLSAPDVTSCASESRIYSAWRRRFSGAKFQTSPRPRSAQTGLSLSLSLSKARILDSLIFDADKATRTLRKAGPSIAVASRKQYPRPASRRARRSTLLPKWVRMATSSASTPTSRMRSRTGLDDRLHHAPQVITLYLLTHAIGPDQWLQRCSCAPDKTICIILHCYQIGQIVIRR